MKIFLDFESRGVIDLGGPGKPGCGTHIYAAHPDTEILMCAWKHADGRSGIWWPGTPFPFPIWEEGWVVVAHNAAFERAMWREKMDEPDIPLANWDDTAARAAMCGLPRKLEQACKALGLPIQKDMEGHKLMMQMCKPKKLSKKELLQAAEDLGDMDLEDAKEMMLWIIHQLATDPTAPHNLIDNYHWAYKWKDDEASLQRLASYCMADVLAEEALDLALPEMPVREREIWELDQLINDRGVQVDVEAARGIQAVIEIHTSTLAAELQELTGGAVSSAKAAASFSEYLGLENMQKDTITEALKAETDPTRRRLLEIRQSLGQSSVTKLPALFLSTSPYDHRIRGMFMYHGAGTGRWAGKGYQPHNLPRGNPDLFECPDDIISAMRMRDPRLIEVIWGDPIEAASNCLRGLLVASPGKTLVAADFASIEGRGLAWVAGEEHVLQGYWDGLDPYKVDAGVIYHLPYEQINKQKRTVGKVMNLSGGYGGGIAAMKRFGADKLGLSDPELTDIVKKWRQGHPMTTKLWEELDGAAMNAVKLGGVHKYRRIAFGMKGKFLCMRLPNGRLLRYYAPRIDVVPTPWGSEREAVTVMNVNSLTKQWQRRPMHGGLWTENAVQALCRDILADALFRVEALGYPVVLHVHDEIVSEHEDPDLGLYEKTMAVPPTWADGFPISAKGWVGHRFKKD